MTRPTLEYRIALEDIVHSLDPTFFCTLTFNRDATLPGMRKQIARFHARLDNALHGHDWSRHPSSKRSDALWFTENLGSNGHAHGLLTIPNVYFFDGLCAIPGKVIDPRELILKIGRSLAPSADCDVQTIYNLPGAIEYSMKDWRDPTAWVLASEFHSPTSLSRH